MRVRLSSNESPFGPSPAAVEAARRVLSDAHRYPDDQSRELRAALARHHGVTPVDVAVGTGSAALLMDLIPSLSVGANEPEVLAFARSFVVYRLAAENVGARYREVADAGEGRDVGSILDALGPDTRVVVIDNPGNPTGAHLTGDALRQLVEALPAPVTLVVDEAYHHFARGQRGYRTVAELGLQRPNVVTLATFSKAYALAGLRVGYALGDPSVIGPLDARRTRFNVTATGQAAALASLGDAEHLERTVRGTLAGRARMEEALTALGVRFTAGLGNFVTLELGVPSAPVVDAFATHGVGVRPLGPYGMDEHVRVTVGTPEEVDAFLAAAERVLAADRS